MQDKLSEFGFDDRDAPIVPAACACRETCWKRSYACGFVCVLSALFTAGCGRGTGLPQTYAVQGTVTYQGRLVKGAQVSFVAVSAGEDRRGANGTTDAEGRYTLRTYFGGRESAEGVLPGEYQVGILALDTAQFAQGKPSTSTRPKNLLPEKYGNPKTSGLTANVLEEHGQRFDFVLGN